MEFVETNGPFAHSDDPAIADAIAAELARSAARAERHTQVGRGLAFAALALLGWLVWRRRRVRRRVLTFAILVCALAGAWASYHGWLLGPLQTDTIATVGENADATLARR